MAKAKAKAKPEVKADAKAAEAVKAAKAAKAKSIGKDTKPNAKKGPETTKKPKDKKPKPPKYTRAQSVADVLKRRQVMTKVQLAEKADELYAKNRGNPNLRESKWATDHAIPLLIALGLLDVSEAGVVLKK